jgi:Protein of unknown function (DUF3105)
VSNKKTKKRPSQPGVDRNVQRRQRLEARREAKAAAEKARQRAELRRRIVTRTLATIVIAGLVWFLFLRPDRPTEIGGHELLQFRESIDEPNHVTGTVDYTMNPPVSGQHSASVIACGKYAEQPPAERYVHALEHGAVGLLYDPEGLPIDGIRQLEEIVDQHDSHVLSAPWPGMPTPIAITSWGEMMRLEEVDVPAINEYIDTFIQGGPEQGIDCPMDSNDPFEEQ